LVTGDDILDRLGQPHAALGVGRQLLELALAAAAGVDLALDHVERAGKRLRRFLRLVGGEDGDAVGDRSAVALQELLGLIFMNVHAWRPSLLIA
jgi:hypothetical protein